MTIDRDTLLRIAELSHLEIPASEEERLIGDMNKIVSYFEMLNRLDVSEAEAMSHIITQSNVLRDDNVAVYPHLSALTQGAPDVKDGAFKVPKMLD